MEDASSFPQESAVDDAFAPFPGADDSTMVAAATDNIGYDNLGYDFSGTAPDPVAQDPLSSADPEPAEPLASASIAADDPLSMLAGDMGSDPLSSNGATAEPVAPTSMMAEAGSDDPLSSTINLAPDPLSSDPLSAPAEPVAADPLSTDDVASAGPSDSDLEISHEITAGVVPDSPIMASYGQLLSQSQYSDSVLAGAGEIQPDVMAKEDTTHQSRAIPLEVTVSDPVKRVEGSVIPGVAGGYVTYKIHTKTQLPAYKAREIVVRRRFKDFVDLADLMSLTQRGYFVPPRPEKNAVESQRSTKDFIEGRRGALEKYLGKLAAHPVISHSAELRVFLECDGELVCSPEWNALKPSHSTILEGVAKLPKQIIGGDRNAVTPGEATQPTRNTHDFMRMFKELKTAIVPDGKVAMQVTPVTEEEIALKQENNQVVEFEVKLTDTTRKAEHLVKRLEDVGNVLGDIGLSFIKIAKFEDEDGLRCGQYTASGAACKTIAADSRRMGMAAVRLSRLSRTATVQSAIQLSQLHDYLALMPGIRGALREREDARVTMTAIEEDLADKQRKVGQLEEQSSKVFGGDKNRTKKVTELQNTVATLEAAKTASNAEYDRVMTRNKSEMERYRMEKDEDFMNMLVGFARVQAAYAERSFNVWLGVAEEFGVSASVANELSLGL